jgi:hypothetical protein
MCLSLAICHIEIRLVDSLSWTLTSLLPGDKPKARVGVAGVLDSNFQVSPTIPPCSADTRHSKRFYGPSINELSLQAELTQWSRVFRVNL